MTQDWDKNDHSSITKKIFQIWRESIYSTLEPWMCFEILLKILLMYTIMAINFLPQKEEEKKQNDNT